MTIKVYISGICGSQEVRKHQQRVLFILQTLPIDLEVIDVTEPGRDEDLNFLQETAKKHDKKTQLPPQIFNNDVYCGDYADFELANDDDDIMKFLKLESGPLKAEILKSGGTLGDTITQNGINHEDEKEVSETDHSNIIENSDEKSALSTDENVPQSEEKVPESEETEPKVLDSNKIDQKVTESEEPQKESSEITESKKKESEEEESEEESE